MIQRKVFQTSGLYAGARYTTKLFSIVQTCKINNINVERYFDYVLKNINNEQIENLLPYSSKIKNKIGSELNSHMAEFGGLKNSSKCLLTLLLLLFFYDGVKF